MLRPSPRIRIVKHTRGSPSIQMQRRAETAERRAAQAMHRLESILHLSLKLAEACDEDEVAQQVLPVAVELSGAEGGAFVPLDEHELPRAAQSFGKMPTDDLSAWLEYLASPSVRERCNACEAKYKLARFQDPSASCPLLKTSFGALSNRIYCLPVRRNDHEYGLLSLFLPQAKILDDYSAVFLGALIDQTSLAMDGMRIRNRELEAVSHLQTWRRKVDLHAQWGEMLEDVIRALEAGFAILVLQDRADHNWLVRGDFPDAARGKLDGFIERVFASGEPGSYANFARESLIRPDLSSLLAAPIMADEQHPFGVLLAGNLRQQAVGSRQLALLQAIAGRVGSMIQSEQSMAELEYQTIVKERSRLSREIHDGLAQTLAFLKLQTAQLQQFLAQGDHEHLQQGLRLSYNTLNEAYEDARQAIDGLRIELNGKGLSGWLDQVLAEFKDASGIDVRIGPIQVNHELSPEVHAQLIRIVQEALSNVRKHTRASHVWVGYMEDETGMVMQIRDDGIGFHYEEATGLARHGLQGMRERAELIGAELQVLSEPNEGTMVRLRLPWSSAQLKGLLE